ncbi:uncharacterized protein LOC112203576 [Rosa chinensis]|uniref:uncharacterized protein LOC112203576 n=1 Tax=Rosa chinensis TaxID=74649 RepID=UPI000D0942E1|nr:uncharacterized protein LOC112203576 [Rosa chinensis]
MRQSLADILDVQVVDKHEKYLGIPNLVGRSKADTFAYIKDNLSKKLTGVWNQALLQELFPLHITQKILALPLNNRMHDDRWIWFGDKKGGFNVKSAYHIAQDRVLGENFGMPNPSAELWNRIWQAPVPGKVKICVWKVASNILPSRSRLSERGIDIDTQCPFCDEEIKSPLHALRDCSHASSFLQLANIPNVPSSTSVIDWLVASYSQSPTTFATLLMGWEEFKVPYSSSRLASPIQNVRWKKPPIGMIKLNVDAAFSNVDGNVDVGGVFRDFEGSCLGGFRHTLPAASSARHAELVALLVHHVHRAANIVAHTLAQDAKNGQFFMQLFTVPPPTVPPPNVVELISIDCNDL